jgi:hypothetical protein
MIVVLILTVVACVVSLFAGVYTDHRQTCRKKNRRLLATVTATAHRKHLEEGWRAMGGSGGRR